MTIPQGKRRANIFRLGFFLFVLTFLAGEMYAQEVFSVKNGNWEDPTVWSTGIVPDGTNPIGIRHNVTKSSKMWVEGTGTFDIMPGATFNLNAEMKVMGRFANRGTFVHSGDMFNYGVVENYQLYQQTGNTDCSYTSPEGPGDPPTACRGFFNMQTGSVINMATINLVGDLVNRGSWTMLGQADMTGNLHNYGTMLGPNGIFFVCGNGYNESGGSVSRNPVYLCLRCKGIYTDKGEGTFNLNCSPFPVILNAFSGNSKDEAVLLNWTTGSEQNSSEFEIERADALTSGDCVVGSCDANIDFRKVGSVMAAGNSSDTRNYSFTDKNAVQGVNFYRLKIVDMDGTFTLSKVIEVYHQVGETQMLVWPNPSFDVINIRITRNMFHNGKLSLYDLTGKLVWQQEMAMADNETRLTIPVCNYAAGTYILNYTYDNKKLTRKVILTK